MTRHVSIHAQKNKILKNVFFRQLFASANVKLWILGDQHIWQDIPQKIKWKKFNFFVNQTTSRLFANSLLEQLSNSEAIMDKKLKCKQKASKSYLTLTYKDVMKQMKRYPTNTCYIQTYKDL